MRLLTMIVTCRLPRQYLDGPQHVPSIAIEGIAGHTVLALLMAIQHIVVKRKQSGK